MKHSLVALFLLIAGSGQAQRLWTQTDQRYTVENLRRTRDALTRETQNLTHA